MTVFINSKPKDLPAEVNTVEKLLEFLRIPHGGTGVGINNRLIKSKDWSVTFLKPEDNILIISATYGG